MFSEIYNRIKSISFHMPGHKKGRGSKKILARNILKLDTTELDGLDNLYYPEGIIKKAQDRLSKLYNSKESFFLINGSTSGILAGLGSAFKPGDKLLMGRDSHRSVFHGVEIFNLIPEYISPEIDMKSGIPMGYNPEEIRTILKQKPDIRGMLFTSPNYFGIVSDLKEISAIGYEFDIPVILDEAHGAHLRFSESMPISGTELPIDIVLQSPHKTLSAMNQGAYLHFNGSRIDIERLKHYLRIFQSTSPSYPIMISLDEARKEMEDFGSIKLSELLETVKWFGERLKNIKGFEYLTEKDFKGFEKDISRVVIRNLLDMDTAEIAGILSSDYEIDIEASINECLILIVTINNRRSDFRKLYKALKKISDRGTLKAACEPEAVFIDKCPEMVISPGRASYIKKGIVSLEEAEGKISGEYIVPYPPGIPLLVPGEEISRYSLDYIKDILSRGYIVNGISKDNTICIIDT